ncbi:hypothetical protein BVRB_8g200120 [Beta vulgaris subsp. vulgaris]|uniref:Prolamin-like domain-containing protein n=1 Tax=Beta vulgaris subsp. vulgaris TaxID=3555 RepID=A0A7G2RM91_BETVV|nr:hypothetical protein BVRB_8g200120 [Beta vulgaris subsp. vulgaris]
MAARSMSLLFLAISLAIITISRPSVASIYELDLAPENSLAPDSDIIYSPSPSSDPAFLACASKITLDCAVEVVSNDFFPIHFEAKCCRQLIRMGKKCNGLIVDDMCAEIDKDRSFGMHKRSDHLWNKCLKVLEKSK